MKLLSILAITTLACLMAVAQDPRVINDPNVQKRSVGDFHAIQVAGGIEVLLSQSNEEAVAVSASEPSYRNRIITVVRDGVLHIYLQQKWWNWNWNEGNLKLRAYVSCKSLDRLREAGGANIHIDHALRSDRLDVHLTGGGRIQGKFAVGEMTVGITGGGESYISGSAGHLEVHVTGGGAIRGYDLVADNCQASIHGGGNIYVTVNKTLHASVSGGGDIRYKGDGSVSESHTTGGGSISRG